MHLLFLSCACHRRHRQIHTHHMLTTLPPPATRRWTTLPMRLPHLLLTFILALTAYLSYQILRTTPDFPVATITEDLHVDWVNTGQPPFDPRDRCPKDFFQRGFLLLRREITTGGAVHFLYHKGHNLLYRIDRDVIGGVTSFGLHWVTSTRFGAKYRIADPTFRGGRTVYQPTATGKTVPRTYHYGQAVGKRPVRPGRELFSSTHITTDPDCGGWADLFNFKP